MDHWSCDIQRAPAVSNGTTEFFSTPERAHEWFVQEVVYPNPRLTEQDKLAVVTVANDCYQFATTGPWTDPLGVWEHGQDDAAQYFNCLRNSIQSVPQDSGILSVLEVATEASEDVAAPPDSMLNQAEGIASGRASLRIPWWLYVLGAVGIYRAVRS